MSKDSSVSQNDTLTYVQEMLRELTALCKANRLKETAYFVQMAYIQVSDEVRESRAHQGDAPVSNANTSVTQ